MKATNNCMSSFVLIEKNMEPSHIHLARKYFTPVWPYSVSPSLSMQLKLLSSTVFILNLDIMKDSRVGVFKLQTNESQAFYYIFPLPCKLLCQSQLSHIYLAFSSSAVQKFLTKAIENSPLFLFFLWHNGQDHYMTIVLSTLWEEIY